MAYQLSTIKIKNNIKNQKKQLNDAKLQEVTNKTSCKSKLRSTEHQRRMERLYDYQ